MKKILVLLSAVFAFGVCAADYYVDYAKGKRTGDGTRNAPFERFARAFAKAAPGDRIFILPYPGAIHDTLAIRGRSGVPGKPIVIDAMFNTFTGADPVSLKDWKLVDAEKGIYKATKKTSRGYRLRFAMVMRDKLVRMGRHSKWKARQALKKVSELKDYEWTRAGDNDFYFRIPASQTPQQAGVCELVRDAGASFAGKCSHITIRNMIATRVWNDGYNIHGDCRGIVFENVAAIECVDDGVSAHETCECVVRNMLSLGNGTGFCHIQNCRIIHENIYIAGTDSRDIYLLNSYNKLLNVAVNGQAPGTLGIVAGKVELENCTMVNRVPDLRFEISPKASVSAEKSVALDYKAPAKPLAGLAFSGDSEAARRQAEQVRDSLMKIFKGKLPAIAAPYLK